MVVALWLSHYGCRIMVVALWLCRFLARHSLLTDSLRPHDLLSRVRSVSDLLSASRLAARRFAHLRDLRLERIQHYQPAQPEALAILPRRHAGAVCLEILRRPRPQLVRSHLTLDLVFKNTQPLACLNSKLRAGLVRFGFVFVSAVCSVCPSTACPAFPKPDCARLTHAAAPHRSAQHYN
eukprot:COSAG04_NODE_1363_length_7079_cov_19.484815_3_plen_180_part_00